MGSLISKSHIDPRDQQFEIQLYLNHPEDYTEEEKQKMNKIIKENLEQLKKKY